MADILPFIAPDIWFIITIAQYFYIYLVFLYYNEKSVYFTSYIGY